MTWCVCVCAITSFVFTTYTCTCVFVHTCAKYECVLGLESSVMAKQICKEFLTLIVASFLSKNYTNQRSLTCIFVVLDNSRLAKFVGDICFLGCLQIDNVVGTKLAQPRRHGGDA